MKVYRRSERQQGKFPKHGRASVVVRCKIQEEKSYPRLPTLPMSKGSMRSTTCRSCFMRACGHTRVLLLSMVRMQVLAAVPLLFTALHMYSPSSSGKVSGRYRQNVSPLSMYW